MMDALTKGCFVYVGTYTHGKSKGIYIFRFDGNTGRLEPAGTSSELENPSYLCISKDKRFLYSVIETEVYQGEPGGAVAAYSVDQQTGALRLLNIRTTQGRHPCHLSTDSHNRFLFVSNYSAGTLTIHPLEKDGHIGSPPAIIRHEGSGPDRARQEAPHVHYAALTPDEKYLCAVDLGLDKVIVYDFSAKNGHTPVSEKLPVSTKPGSGPRHMAFSPNGNFAYVLTEMSSEVAAFQYDSAGCRFSHIQTVSALPPDFKAVSSGAAIHMSPDGEYLYTSNRGHDSLTVFKADPTSGMLKLVSHIPTQGSTPRDFAIDPSGRFLLAANQDSDTLVAYAINAESGVPEPSGSVTKIPNPTCVMFAGFA